jgi:hypothetical protein
MTNDVPGSGQPDPSEPPEPPTDASPTEVVPPAQPPVTPPPLDATPTEVVPPAQPGWGAPPPTSPAPEAPLAAAPPPAGPPPGGQPPAGQPPAQPGQWGTPPAQPAQQPAGWGPGPAPGAPQQPGWAPAAAPGGAPPPDGTWQPAPASSSGNGCLKGCIIVGIILVVIAVLGIAALVFFSRQLVSGFGVNPDTGQAQQCTLITDEKLDAVFGGNGAQTLPLQGFANATFGQLLDKRILKDADSCWIVASGTDQEVTGRIAAQDGLNASGDFQSAKSAAQEGGYFAGDLSGFGDEAFCTSMSQVGSFGILVRSGGRLVYVSLLDPRSGTIGDWVTTPDGLVTSPDTCKLAGEVAAAVLQ